MRLFDIVKSFDKLDLINILNTSSTKIESIEKLSNKLGVNFSNTSYYRIRRYLGYKGDSDLIISDSSGKEFKYLNNRSKRIPCLLCGSEDSCNCKDLTNGYSNKRFISSVLNPLSEYFGFDIKTLGTSNFVTEFNRVKSIIDYDYNVLKLSIKELFLKYNNYKYITRLVKRLGLSYRDKSETQKVLLLNSGSLNTTMYKNKNWLSKQFKTEYHKSWDGNTYFLRSSYEIEYANYLDSKRIKYLVEGLLIKYYDSQKNCYRYAIPDFYLTESNEIHEIKSSWTFDKINMVDKFNEYIKLGYKVKLIYEKSEYSYDEMINKL